MLIVLLLTGLLGTTPLDGLAHPRASVREAATNALWSGDPVNDVWLERGMIDPRPEVRRRTRHIRFMLDSGLTPDMPAELLNAASAIYAVPVSEVDERQAAARRLAALPGGAALLVKPVVADRDLALAMVLVNDLSDAALPLIKRGDHDAVAELLTLVSEVRPEMADAAWATLAAETDQSVPPRLRQALAKFHLLTFEPGDDPEPLRTLARRLLAGDNYRPAFALRKRVGDQAMALDALPFPYQQLVTAHFAQRRHDEAGFDAALQVLVENLNRGLRTNDLADVMFLDGQIDAGLEMQEPSLVFEISLLRQRGDVPGMRAALERARASVGMTARGRDEVDLAWAAHLAALALDDDAGAAQWLAAIGNGGVRPQPDTTGLDLSDTNTAQYLAALYRLQPERAAELLESLRAPQTRAVAASAMMAFNSPLAAHAEAYWAALGDEMPAAVQLDLLRTIVVGSAEPAVVSGVAEALDAGRPLVALLDAYDRADEATAAAQAWVDAEPDSAEAFIVLAARQEGADEVALLRRAFDLALDADTASAVAFELSRRSLVSDQEREKWAALARLIPLGKPGPILRNAAALAGGDVLMDLLEPGRRMAVPLEYEAYETLDQYARAAIDAGAHAAAAEALDDIAIFLHTPTIRFTTVEGFLNLFQLRRGQAALALWEAGDIDAAVLLALEAVEVPGGDVDVTIAWLRRFDEAGLRTLADEVYQRQMAPVLIGLEAEPGSSLLHNRAAWVSASVDRRHDDALDWAVRANEIAPESTSIRDTLAEALVRRGDWAQGLAIFEQIAAEEPLVRQHQQRLAEGRAVVARRLMRLLPG